MTVQPETRPPRPAPKPAPKPALSPSRAADFKQCPLLYRFRAIDRLPEAPSAAQLRGSVVHAALEQLYGLPAVRRGPDAARSLVESAWEHVVAAEPDLAGQFDPDQRSRLIEEARDLLSGYYRLEDPTRFDPQCCEERVEVELADGTLLRGFIDRIDVAATGEVRVVDYKTGKAPPAARAAGGFMAEFKAMFQMKFYAVALLRSRGVLPTRLRLIYLADGQVLDYSPDHDELLRFEKTLMAMWRAIQSAGQSGDFRPKQSRLCDWCPHQQHCPLFGGTPPPYPGWPETSAVEGVPPCPSALSQSGESS
ncbi:RecB family exonuclease [Mycobacterium sp. THU-M116]